MSERDEREVICRFLPDDTSVKWQVVKADVRESLNHPHLATLTVRTEAMDAEPSELLGQSCAIELERDDLEAHYGGIVTAVKEGRSDERWVFATLTVSAALGLLSQGRQTRVFQEKKVPDILEDVLGTRLGEYDRSVELRMQRDYPVCEYRLQYDESDLDYCHRLMEEEGIVYWFEHDGSVEQLVLSDDPHAYPSVDSVSGASIPFFTGEGHGGREGITALERARRLKPTKVTMRHYDWTRPTVAFEQAQEGEAEGDQVDGSAVGPLREDYQHGIEPPTFHDYDSGKKAFRADDGSDQAAIRRHRQSCDATTFEGAGGVIGFSAGRIFEVAKHPRAEFEDKYLLVSLGWSFSSQGDGSGTYSNRFEAIPADTVYVPPKKTAKPRVQGIETATVVGQGDQEIFTDEHGRVKVQFHWDREGKNDDHSSCFIRVVQPWAGAGWGFVFLPRVGMEVTVGFVHGDPDRPIVTGTLYNGQNAPPYPMPDEMTKSTIRTQSSLGGGGYNELSFEDKKGSEEVYIRAQKNLREQILSDQSSTIGNDQTTEISANQSLTVGADREVTVGANQKVEIAANSETTVGAEQETTVAAGRKLTVGANNQHTIGANDVRQVGGNLDQKVAGNVMSVTGGAVTETIAGPVTETVGGPVTQTIGGPRTLTVGGPNVMTSGGPTAITAAGPISMVAPKIALVTPSLDHISPNWIEVIATESTAKGNVLEVVGNKIEAVGLHNVAVGVENAVFVLSQTSGGVAMGFVGLDIQTQGLALEQPALKVIS